ncbi:hypothetical protein MMC22_003758 [Lobaria immixta]|nr:hypothetical protein [Lobaria immixta]
MTASIAETSALLEALATAGRKWSQHELAAREELLNLAHSLIAALEMPSEFVHRIGIAEPAMFAAIRLAVDLRLFEKLSEGGDVPTTVNQLANTTGTDVLLIGRAMKHLAALNVVAEAGADQYLSTPLSNTLTNPSHRDGIGWTFNATGPSLRSLPAYLQHTGYKNPSDGSDGPSQYAHNTNLSLYEWIDERPLVLNIFHNHMVGRREGVIKRTDHGFYPVEEKLGKDLRADKEAVLLVDIGGGLGHDLEDFRAGYPLLQDVWSWRIYRRILHNWMDEQARKILRQLVPAMQRGYSKLLINENVIPDVNASWWVTTMDWQMMAMLAVHERTERQWHELLGSVGLRVVKIWTPNPAAESLIEAELDGNEKVVEQSHRVNQ